MLKLNEETRNQILNYLKGIQVTAQVGADIMQICNALDSLEKIEEPKTPPEPIPEATGLPTTEVNS